jgi:hypothetical protein
MLKNVKKKVRKSGIEGSEHYVLSPPAEIFIVRRRAFLSIEGVKPHS